MGHSGVFYRPWAPVKAQRPGQRENCCVRSALLFISAPADLKCVNHSLTYDLLLVIPCEGSQHRCLQWLLHLWILIEPVVEAQNADSCSHVLSVNSTSRCLEQNGWAVLGRCAALDPSWCSHCFVWVLCRLSIYHGCTQGACFPFNLLVIFLFFTLHEI